MNKSVPKDIFRRGNFAQKEMKMSRINEFLLLVITTISRITEMAVGRWRTIMKRYTHTLLHKLMAMTVLLSMMVGLQGPAAATPAKWAAYLVKTVVSSLKLHKFIENGHTFPKEDRMAKYIRLLVLFIFLLLPMLLLSGPATTYGQSLDTLPTPTAPSVTPPTESAPADEPSGVADDQGSADQQMDIATQANGPLSVDFRDNVFDVELQNAIIAALANKPSDLLIGASFAITSQNRQGDWLLISVASLDGPGSSLEFVGAGESGGLLLAGWDGERWQVALAGTTDFTKLIALAPESLVSQEARTLLDPLAVAPDSPEVVSYKFPWPVGNWTYRQGWHPTPQAVDIGTYNSDRRVLNSAGGSSTITYICMGTLSANVKVSDSGGKVLQYFHLDKNLLGPGIVVGAVIQQGRVLGSLRPGTWTWDGCGYTSGQQSNSAHVHWVIPTTGPFTADGWTITYPSNTWYQGSSTKNPGQSLYSTNVPNYGGGCTPGANQVSLFVDANYQGSCVTKSLGDYANPGAIGLPNDSISSVKIGTGAKAILCEHDNFAGVCETFTSSDSDLSNNAIGSDRVSSARVQVAGGGSCTPGTNQVSLFVDAGYQGSCVTKNLGDYANPGAIGLPNDSISSVKIGTGAKAILCEHDNFAGLCETFTSSDSDLSNNAIGTDRVSSARVQTAGGGNLALNRPSYATSQQGPEYAPTRGNDGNLGTRWSSQGTGDQWWWVDLSTVSWNQVVIRWEAAYAALHFVGYSYDGVTFYGNWYTISAAGAYLYNLGTHTARYAGVLMRTPAPGMGNYSFWEFEVTMSGLEPGEPQDFATPDLVKPDDAVVLPTRD